MELVQTAFFDGVLAIPIIEPPKKFIITNVRWSDERSYTTKGFKTFSFLSLQSNFIKIVF